MATVLNTVADYLVRQSWQLPVIFRAGVGWKLGIAQGQCPLALSTLARCHREMSDATDAQLAAWPCCHATPNHDPM